ncbi:MAG: hypothetical protein WAT19_17015 [Ferruginibacter sp.]
MTSSKKNTKKELNLEKAYYELINKASKYGKWELPIEPKAFDVKENFKKFSLFTGPNSITSFDTNASL